MSGRPLLITKRQAKTLIMAAKETGGEVVFDPQQKVFRFLPAPIHSEDVEAATPVDEEPKGYL